MDLVLRTARLGPRDAPTDVVVRDGRIAELTPSAQSMPDEDLPSIELDGRFVIPGRWDHHVHFDQWAMVRRRVDVSPATSAAHAVTIVAASLANCEDDVAAGFGYREALWPDAPDAHLLDEVSSTRPIVLASADLHSAWLNSTALRRFGFSSDADGRILEQDAARVFEALTAIDEATLDGWVDEAVNAAAARGVVGIVDLESPLRIQAWQRRIGRGTRQVRVECGVWTARLNEVIAAGIRTGDAIPGTDDLVRMGPFKVITDGSLNTRTAYCRDPYPDATADPYGRLLVPPDDLVPLMARAHAAGLACAIHAIGDHANSLALDAFAATGARGSIEHAQLLDPADLERFAQLGVTASVQPEHAMDDRDVADRHWAGRTDRAFMLRALLDSGARLTFGSDAPVAPLDPWEGISAAVARARDGREPWHGEQAISVSEALAASAHGGAGRNESGRLRVGADADLVVLDGDPHTADPLTLRSMPVAATMLAGHFTYGFDSQA